MYRHIIVIVIVSVIGFSSLAQNTVNDYKYVVVPQKFEFFKGKDKYRTSTLTRYLFKKEGFEVYFEEEELPKDLFQNRCLALYAKVLKVSSFLNTKVKIQLNDCEGNQVFLTQEASTKVKEYDKAYPIVIKEAFRSIEALDYTYNINSTVGSENQIVIETENTVKNELEAKTAKAEVERLRKEVEELKQQKAVVNTVKEPKITTAKSDNNPLDQKSDTSVTDQDSSQNSLDEKSNLLYAQSVDNGYQLVDASPKVVMIILKTAAPNVFTVKGENAIVYKENDMWFYSKNETKTPLNIKF